MGFIDTSSVAQPSVFYNVVHAVGKNCPNMGEDVKLVQYLLKILYDKFPPPSIDYIDENQIIRPNPKKVPEVVGGF